MNYIKETQLEDIIKQALKDDIGRRDITTEAIIPKDKFVKAVLVAQENCVVCGINLAGLVFKLKDKSIKFKPQVEDGEQIKKGKVLARFEGKAQSILTAERVALNFVTLLSGIATSTRTYVEKVRPYKAKIMDTRKTIPGLRALQKYAVRIGGGYNHRFKLDEMVLIKDNHIKIINPKSEIRNPMVRLRSPSALSVVEVPKSETNPKSQIQNLSNAVEQIKKNISKKIKIEVEVKNLREFKEALNLRPDIIMLDNMNIKDIRRAVKICKQLPVASYQLPVRLEASGGITLKNVKKIASTGVDMISIGALTHSVDSVDISLEIV